MLTSKTFSSEEAKQLGIVNKVVDQNELDNAVEEFIAKFNKLPPIAVGKVKMLINKSLDNDMISR